MNVGRQRSGQLDMASRLSASLDLRFVRVNGLERAGRQTNGDSWRLSRRLAAPFQRLSEMEASPQEIERAFKQMPDWQRHQLAQALLECAAWGAKRRTEAVAPQQSKPVAQRPEKKAA